MQCIFCNELHCSGCSDRVCSCCIANIRSKNNHHKVDAAQEPQDENSDVIYPEQYIHAQPPAALVQIQRLLSARRFIYTHEAIGGLGIQFNGISDVPHYRFKPNPNYFPPIRLSNPYDAVSVWGHGFGLIATAVIEENVVIG